MHGVFISKEQKENYFLHRKLHKIITEEINVKHIFSLPQTKFLEINNEQICCSFKILVELFSNLYDFHFAKIEFWLFLTFTDIKNTKQNMIHTAILAG